LISYWLNFILIPLVLVGLIISVLGVPLYLLIIAFMFLHFLGERASGKWQLMVQSEFGMRESVVLALALTLSIIALAITLSIAWIHNPQCEFHCEGVILWSNWLPYGLVSALLAYTVSYTLGMVILILSKKWCRT
jgi:hypothetical protein